VNVFDLIGKTIVKNLPEKHKSSWNEYVDSTWEDVKTQTWFDVLEKTTDSEIVAIKEYFTAILTKYQMAADALNIQDNIAFGIEKNILENTAIEDIVSFSVLNSFEDTSNLADYITKAIVLNLPKDGNQSWNTYLNNAWENLQSKSWLEVLKKTMDMDEVNIAEYFKAIVTKHINPEDAADVLEYITKNIDKMVLENINVKDMNFFDVFKIIQDTANVTEFIEKVINKNIYDTFTVTDTYKQEVNKKTTEDVNIQENVYSKVIAKPVYAMLEILDMDYNKVAIVTNAWDVYITEAINGAYSLNFKIPINDANKNYMDDKHYVRVSEQIFMFTQIVPERTQSQTFISIEAQSVFFELDNEYWESDNEASNYMSNVDATTAMTRLLNGTPFTLLSNAAFDNTDLLFKRGSKMENLKTIIDTYGGELWRSNYQISLQKRIGTDKGIQFRYSKNIKTIKKTIDIRNLVTRLYVYGKDGLTIDGVNNGKAYLDSQYIGLYRKVRTKAITFNDVEDPAVLLKKGVEYLAQYELPQVTYQVNVMELKKLSGMVYDESFNLGDTVTIIDEELAADVKTRIVEYKYYPFENKESSVILGSFVPRSTDFFSRWNNAANTVNNAFFNTGKLNTNWLQGQINALQNRLIASGSYESAKVLPDAGFLLENTDAQSPDYGALYLGPGIFAIADTKAVTGDWDWRTFGTGAGFTADVMNTGTLNAQKVNVTNLNANNINTGTLDANIVNVTNMNASNIKVGTLDASIINVANFSADYIHGGTIDAYDVNIANLVVGNNVTMGVNAVLSWNNITNRPYIPDNDDIGYIATEITNNTVTTSFINALGITAKAVSSDWVYTGQIDIDTNAKVGNNLYIGDRYSSDKKSITFSNDSTISSSSGLLTINSWNGADITTTGNFNIFGDSLSLHSNYTDLELWAGGNLRFNDNIVVTENWVTDYLSNYYNTDEANDAFCQNGGGQQLRLQVYGTDLEVFMDGEYKGSCTLSK
jgi:phage minor structural protein